MCTTLHADLSRRGLDPALLDLDLSSELPAELRVRPAYVELTEVGRRWRVGCVTGGVCVVESLLCEWWSVSGGEYVCGAYSMSERNVS